MHRSLLLGPSSVEKRQGLWGWLTSQLAPRLSEVITNTLRVRSAVREMKVGCLEGGEGLSVSVNSQEVPGLSFPGNQFLDLSPTNCSNLFFLDGFPYFTNGFHCLFLHKFN